MPAIAMLVVRQTLAPPSSVADANGQPLLFPEGELQQRLHRNCRRHRSYGAAILLRPGAREGVGRVESRLREWTALEFPFAPHDLGTYPHATGQVSAAASAPKTPDAGRGNGNMLILRAAIAKMDRQRYFAGRYWPVLTKWAEYLPHKGFDPEINCPPTTRGSSRSQRHLSAKASSRSALSRS